MYGSGEPKAKVHIKERSVARGAMRSVSLGIAEAYMNHQIEIEDPLDNALQIAYLNGLPLTNYLIPILATEDRQISSASRKNILPITMTSVMNFTNYGLIMRPWPTPAPIFVIQKIA